MTNEKEEIIEENVELEKMEPIQEKAEELQKKVPDPVDDTRDFCEDFVVTVTDMVIDMDLREKTEISRISFETNKGRITYKPKISKEVYEGALKIRNEKRAKLSDLPQIITTIGEKLRDGGKCEVTASYFAWNTYKDDEPVTYRYVPSGNVLDKWVVN